MMAADDDIVDGELIDDEPEPGDEPEFIDADVLEDDRAWPVFDAAIEYLEAGWTPTPLKDKIPTQKKWTTIKPSRPDCWSWWVEEAHNGVGIVCGRISNNLIVIDIEKELVADQPRMLGVIAAIPDEGARSALLQSFQRSAATTPSGGRHLYLSVTDRETVPGNLKLAFRGTGDEAVLLVETRGEGGQAAAPPGDGRDWIGESGPGKTTAVTGEQLDHILAAFRSLDESGIKHSPPPKPSKPYIPDADREPTVADAWSKMLMAGAITWADVLDPGWTANGYDEAGRSLWVRPDYGDKTKAPYSAKGFERWIGGARPVLVVHSTSVPHLPHGPQQRLTPARAWAHCYFNGDEAAANAALEMLATEGEADPRIRDVPTCVLDEARAIAATKTRPPELAEFTPAEGDDFWDARPWLRHIHTFAQSRMVPPFALLSVALVRAIATVPPWVTIPPIIGGKGSLNLFCSLVGTSGAGKTATCAASDELMPWALHWRHVGTGEGLLHMYAKKIREKDPESGALVSRLERINYQVNAIIDEVDTLTAVSSRQGSTIMPILRSAWSGSSIGFSNADQERSLSLDSQSYRLGLVLGAQPTRLQALFDDQDGGTPQRFIWAPLIDRDAPHFRNLPADPGPLPRPALHIPAQYGGADFVLCEQVTDAVRANRHQVITTGDTGGLDGHALFTRVKVAAACAVMDGRLEVTDDDWVLSGVIQAVSDATRSWVQAQIAGAAAAVSAKRAESRAREAVVIDDKVTKGRIGRVARVLARAVSRHGERTEGQAKKAIGRDKGSLEQAIQFAVEAGWIVDTERPHHQRPEEVIRVLKPGKEAL